MGLAHGHCWRFSILAAKARQGWGARLLELGTRSDIRVARHKSGALCLREHPQERAAYTGGEAERTTSDELPCGDSKSFGRPLRP